MQWNGGAARYSPAKLDTNQQVHQQKVLVFNHNTRYDVIFGTDFLTKTGIDIKYSTGTIQWFDNELPIRDPLSMDNSEFLAMTDSVEQQCLKKLYGIDLSCQGYSCTTTRFYKRRK